MKELQSAWLVAVAGNNLHQSGQQQWGRAKNSICRSWRRISNNCKDSGGRSGSIATKQQSKINIIWGTKGGKTINKNQQKWTSTRNNDDSDGQYQWKCRGLCKKQQSAACWAVVEEKRKKNKIIKSKGWTTTVVIDNCSNKKELN